MMNGRFPHLLFVFFLLLAGCHSESPSLAEQIVLDGTLPLTAPETAVVGTPVEVLVGPVAAPNDVPVFLTLIGSYGNQVLRTTFQNGQAWFQLPAEATRRAGAAKIMVTSGNARGEATIQLLPDTAVSPVTPLVGARSIIADGAHWSMAVVIPFDQFGNPVAEGTNVSLKSLHPNDELRQYDSPITHLLAWERIYSTTQAGRTVISASVGEAYGMEAALLEIAGWPVPFDLFAEPAHVPADGFQLVTLRSAAIVDAQGNQMPDGTLVNFVVTGPESVRYVLPAYTLDGVAETVMQAPSVPGSYQVQAALYGMQSHPLQLDFAPGPAIGAIPAEIAIEQEAGALLLTVGPIVGSLNQFVADGTLVEFEITGPDGRIQTETAVTDAGFASLSLRLAQLAAGRHQVSINAGAGTGTAVFTIP